MFWWLAALVLDCVESSNFVMTIRMDFSIFFHALSFSCMSLSTGSLLESQNKGWSGGKPNHLSTYSLWGRWFWRSFSHFFQGFVVFSRCCSCFWYLSCASYFRFLVFHIVDVFALLVECSSTTGPPMRVDSWDHVCFVAVVILNAAFEVDDVHRWVLIFWQGGG